MSSPFDKVMEGADGEGFEESDLSLLETLDHVLSKGLVIAGEITISVADIDLIFVGLNVLVSSVEKAHEVLRERELAARTGARATLAASTPKKQPEGE
jgi:hypothetical protein